MLGKAWKGGKLSSENENKYEKRKVYQTGNCNSVPEQIQKAGKHIDKNHESS